ncbi:MAG: hypothetical protein AAFY72_10375, partial [Cyanobacteria bacterium J06649_4]
DTQQASKSELGLSFTLPPAQPKSLVSKPQQKPTPHIEIASASLQEGTQQSAVDEAHSVATASEISTLESDLAYRQEPLPPLTADASKTARTSEQKTPVTTEFVEVPIAPPAKADSAKEKIEALTPVRIETTQIITSASENNTIGLSFAANDIVIKPDSKEDIAADEAVFDSSATLPSETPSTETPSIPEEAPLTTELSLSNAGLDTPSNPVENTSVTTKPTIALQFDIGPSESAANPLAVGIDVDSPAILFAQTSLSESELKADGSIGFGDLGLSDWIFENGTDSLVARTVGSAEGTRQWNGSRTKAYYGHVDPGNGVWNQGTFSYQHQASSPEEADAKQLNRLKRQGSELEAQAEKMGLTLTLEEKLNGLDLANQAPMAALDRGGYIERLAQARRLQMTGSEAILWARTHAYIDPDTRRWNAPGLGNNVNSISRDQERRMSEISGALKAFEPAGSESVALAQLKEISLENTGAQIGGSTDEPTATSVTATAQASSTAASNSTNFSSVEVSFGLPPADQTLLAALSTPALPISTREVEENVDSAEVAEGNTGSVATGSVATAIGDRTPSTDSIVNAEAPNTGDSNIGVAFSRAEELDQSTDESVAIAPAAPTEQEVTQEGETTQLSNSDANSRENTDLFSLQGEPAASTEAPDDSSLQSTTSESVTNQSAASSSVSPAVKLQNLLAGISRTNPLTPETSSTEEQTIPSAVEEAQSETEQGRALWRTEDKILDSK